VRKDCPDRNAPKAGSNRKKATPMARTLLDMEKRSYELVANHQELVRVS